MSRERPAIVVVLAILQIAFGGLGLACTTGSTLLRAAGMSPQKLQAAAGPERPQDRVRNKMERMLDARLPSFKLKGRLYSGFGILLSALMVASGVGLLRMARWGWWLAVVYACLSLLAHLANLGYEELVARPVQRAIVADLAANADDDRAAVALAQAATTIAPFLALLFLLYPLGILVLTLLPMVRSAFWLRTDGERYGEDEWEDPPPEGRSRVRRY